MSLVNYYKHAIDIELFLSLYAEWQEGKYKSSRGLINIVDMNAIHLQNAITDLKKRRDIRAALVENLIGDKTNMVGLAKETYNDHEDLLSLKIQELEDELNSRSNTN